VFRAEKAVLLAFWAAAAFACLLGLVHAPSTGVAPNTGREVGDLVRVVCTTALVITLLLGPGLLWRPLTERKIGLGFVPLPGFAILAVAGGLVWVLVGPLGQQAAAFLVLGPVLGLMLGALISVEEDLLSSEERRTLLIVGLPLGIAIARSIWSYGPAGELYEATVSRTLNPEPRSDSRTSYLVAMLVANGQNPYHVTEGLNFFAPYNFSARGPLPGMMSAPLMLLTGCKPKLFSYEAPWMPFDAQGFTVYRIAMMTFSATAYLSVWQLVRRIAGAGAARFALVLAVSTPFLIDDLWFTWPKLLAASFVILGAVFMVERKPFRSGLLVGVGYLMHPSALTALFGIGPLTAWPLRKARLLRPQIRAVVYLALGVAVGVVAWRLVNIGHFQQEGFLEYVEQAYPHYHPTVWQWIQFRLATLGDTLVPFYLLAFHAHSASINVLEGVSPGVVHFFFQYWTGVPFGLGIFFFPLLLWSLYKALRRWPWPVTAAIVIPFVLFTIYWGASITGNLREGMQAWVLALIAVIALQQWASGFPWFRSILARLAITLRAVEVLAVAIGATLGTHSFNPIREHFAINDYAAFGTVVVLSLVLVGVVWRETRSDADSPAAGD
jgi:hypothetical protein